MHSRIPFPLPAAALTVAAVATIGVLLSPGPVTAQTDTATVIVRIGVDTLAIEQWVHHADRLEAVSVYRTPATTVRRYAVDLDGAGHPTRITVQTGDQPAQERAVADGAIPVAGGFYAPFALAVALAAREGRDVTELRYAMGDRVMPVTVRRTGEGIYTLPNQFGGMLEVRTDPEGRVVAVDAGGGTTVERIEAVDLDAVAREFAERDERGTGLGPLSPRESATVAIDGASISIAYGRPSARGRPVMGGLVPFGEVWRTGANETTQLTVDRAIEIGGLRVEPGDYSLLTIPDRDSWTLIINSATGESGLAYDPELDVGRVPMTVTTLPHPVEQLTIRIDEAGDGGVVRVQWERTQASVPIRVVGTGD
jgi:hypothetical protein